MEKLTQQQTVALATTTTVAAVAITMKLIGSTVVHVGAIIFGCLFASSGMNQSVS
uniref:Uncharacterized protein n=1 Tax=Setaria digitata TaxID=48799 RepID=A0A915PXH9_9BILA